jgi:hypothetical protein
MRPEHPPAEIYNESKHGIQFRANIARMNLERYGGSSARTSIPVTAVTT